MKKIIFMASLLLIAGTVRPVHADPDSHFPLSWPDVTPSTGEKEQLALRELMSVMEESTSIATKTKMNADFVPGMVTVLYGDDLAAKGVTRVLDAFALVPGMHVSFENLVVRGVDKWGSGKVKILLNGNPVNHSVTANPAPPLSLPIQAIERIEIVRGPGSAVYGENAFLAVINIVTRTEGKRGFAGYGRYETYAGGGYYTYTSPESGLTMNLNLAGFSSDGARVMSGPDILSSPAINQPGISYAPGPVIDKKQQRSGILTLSYEKWSLEARYLESATSDGFGATDALPPPDDRLIWNQGDLGLNLKREVDLLPRLNTQFKLGWSQYSMAMDHLTFFPPGFVSLDSTGNPLFHPAGVVGSNFVREERFDGGLETTWSGWDRHKILLGLDLASTRLIDAWTEANVDPITLAPQPWQRVEADKTWIKEGANRALTGLILQDQYAITDHFDITSGLRFDHYDDVGDAVTPRIALVYRLTDNHIFKAQFGQAFRPPTFLELYAKNFVITGNPQLKPETIDTYELGYIYRVPDKVGRITLFHSELKNMIVGDNLTGVYKNSTGADLNGVELEMEYSLTDAIKLDGNISYVDSKDEATGGAVEGSANWLGHAGLLVQPIPNYTFALQDCYVGERNRAPTDTRAKLGADNTINLTGTKTDFLQKNVTLRLSMLNLLDARMMEPAYPDLPKDYPRPGRSWGVVMSYDF
ncbi:MAG: TonB-dependent receptor [Magnetococcales bacterium]|nr:TonB-dependent receptor [Magnetococcales bacterium]